MAKLIDRLNPLTVAKCTKPGYYPDGGRLYLAVKASGAKSWIFRYRFGGREREMGLGSVSVFTLAEARERTKEVAKLLADGLDPMAERDRGRAEAKLAAANQLTFDAAAEQYIKSHRAGWKNAKHADQWINTLATYASPVIGSMPVAGVKTEHVMRVLEPIWRDKTETATRLRGRIESILAWCTVQGFRAGDNPAAWRGHLDQLLPKPSAVAKVGNHAALDWRELPAFMPQLRAMPGAGAMLVELCILTACRTSEALLASWSEFDLDAKLWVIPAERMKAKKEHRIPLSDAAMALLSRLRGQHDGDLLFPGRAKKPLSNMVGLQLLKRMGRADLTVHGFRSTFRDWAGEATAHPREVIEHALAHLLKDKAEAAYARGDLLAKRRALMADWGAYCDRPAMAGTVVAIGEARAA
jgi:integrase